jgi:hypothetical protein
MLRLVLGVAMTDVCLSALVAMALVLADLCAELTVGGMGVASGLSYRSSSATTPPVSTAMQASPQLAQT